MSAPILVFDVGGSHIAGALCDVESLRLGRPSSVPLDANGTEQEFYSAVELLKMQLVTPTGQARGMSFAFPGPFDYREGVSMMTHKFASLNGKNLRTAFSAQFGVEPSQIQFVNDADAFLLGEMSQMPSSRAGNTVGITLGTGVGSAFAVDGEIVRSGRGVPSEGEIWNLPWRGGIVEDAISTRGIQGAYERCTGERRTVREIAESTPSDSDAVATFEEFGETLGEVLFSVTGEFRPTTIIFGGAISRSAELFLPFTRRRLNSDTQLGRSTLFENAALLGSAVHWRRVTVHAGKQ